MGGLRNKQDVVKASMTREEDVRKDISSYQNGNERLSVICGVYTCPRAKLCTKLVGTGSFSRNAGWSTPYFYLLSCLEGGNLKKLKELYKFAEQPANGWISSYLISSSSLKAREKTRYQLIDSLISLSLPVSFIENLTVRNSGKLKSSTCIKSIQ